MGRFGKTVFPLVTLTQVDWFDPVPRPRPICTFPSLVPTITVDCKAWENASCVMKDRSPRLCLVRFAGLFTYHVGVVAAPVIVSQTRTVPVIKWPQPVPAPAGPQSLPGVVGSPLKISNGRMNDCVS